jgi:competence ComEA-like helix-hairpin-helix protein
MDLGKARWKVLAVIGWLAAGVGVVLADGPARLEGVVNINTATSDELELLAGVGPAKARAIIEYRQRHAFRTVEELARVKGIGPATVRRLRPNLVVRGPTTVGSAPRASLADAGSAPAPPPEPLAPAATPPRSPPTRPTPPQASRAGASAQPAPRCTAHPCLPPP